MPRKRIAVQVSDLRVSVNGDKAQAKGQAKRALQLLPQGSQAHLRAEDIEMEASRKE